MFATRMPRLEFVKNGLQEQSRNVGIIRLSSFLIWAISLIGEHTLKVRRLGTRKPNAGGTQPIGLNSNFGSKTGLHDTRVCI